jgi:hypothetical protein
MATTKEPPTEEHIEPTSRIPKSKTRPAIRVLVPRAGSKNKPIAFVKRDRKPASSSATHSRVLDDYVDPHQPIEISSLDPEPRVIPQDILDRWLARRKYFTELDDWIASALSRGATVEKGECTAKLEMRRDEDGRTCMKVFVR